MNKSQMPMGTIEDNGTVKRKTKNELLPTLFDRLSDDAPQRKSEAPSEYVISAKKMVDIVKRDLVDLLNTQCAEPHLSRELYPHVADSTLNYGMPALTGSHLVSISWESLVAKLRKVITTYEPRILPQTLEITPRKSFEGSQAYIYNMMDFSIRAQVFMEPYPIEFTVQSLIDLESNRFVVNDYKD